MQLRAKRRIASTTLAERSGTVVATIASHYTAPPATKEGERSLRPTLQFSSRPSHKLGAFAIFKGTLATNKYATLIVMRKGLSPKIVTGLD